MSHQLDLEGVLEKLTLLQHFAHGSEQYCRERLVGSEQDVGDGALDEYWGWVKGIVSAYTLECGIRLRVLLDTVAGRPEADKIVGLDATARSGLVIGQVVDGEFELTLRETCNKIIHAKKVIPVWATGTEGDAEFKYWSGDYELSGVKGSESWRLVLHIAPWARSVERFLMEADSAEVTLYVGQDWYQTAQPYGLSTLFVGALPDSAESCGGTQNSNKADPVNGDSDVLLRLREEEWALLRHYEDQRATVTNFILVMASIAVGFLAQKGMNRDSLPVTVLLIVLGAYGILAAAKLYERIHQANDLAIQYTRLLDELCPNIGIGQLRDKVRAKHKAEFPITSRLRMNYLWIALHSAIALSGIGLTIVIFSQPWFCTPIFR